MNGSTLSDCSIQVDLDTNCLIQGDHLLQIWLWYHYHDIHVLGKKAKDYEETIKWCKTIPQDWLLNFWDISFWNRRIEIWPTFKPRQEWFFSVSILSLARSIFWEQGGRFLFGTQEHWFCSFKFHHTLKLHMEEI